MTSPVRPVNVPTGVRVPSGDPVYNAIPESSGMMAPADHGLAGWSFDLAHAGGALQLSTGVVYLAAVVVREKVTVTKVWAGLSQAGSGLTSGQNLFALYSSAGARLALTNDQTVSFGDIEDWGVKSPAFVTPVELDPGRYWVAVLCNGSAGPSLARAGFAAVAGLPNANLSAATARFGVYGTSQTSMPASITPGNIGRDDASSLWVALS